MADVDLFEINEAFCSVVLSTIDLLGGRPRPLQRPGRRGRLRPSDRRLRRPPGRDARAPAAPARRRHRPGRDLLRRGPGRRDAARGAAGMSGIRRITVVGAGQMGAGIAQVAAVGGFDVTLSDVAPRQLERALSGDPGLADEAGREGPAGRGRPRRRRWRGSSTAAEAGRRRPADRGGDRERRAEAAHLRASWTRWPATAPSSPPTPARSRSRAWPRPRRGRSGWSACTS